jgi:hypothetical protein
MSYGDVRLGRRRGQAEGGTRAEPGFLGMRLGSRGRGRNLAFGDGAGFGGTRAESGFWGWGGGRGDEGGIARPQNSGKHAG